MATSTSSTASTAPRTTHRNPTTVSAAVVTAQSSASLPVEVEDGDDAEVTDGVTVEVSAPVAPVPRRSKSEKQKQDKKKKAKENEDEIAEGKEKMNKAKRKYEDISQQQDVDSRNISVLVSGFASKARANDPSLDVWEMLQKESSYLSDVHASMVMAELSDLGCNDPSCLPLLLEQEFADKVKQVMGALKAIPSTKLKKYFASLTNSNSNSNSVSVNSNINRPTYSDRGNFGGPYNHYNNYNNYNTHDNYDNYGNNYSNYIDPRAYHNSSNNSIYNTPVNLEYID
eukprot:gene21840-24766_t